MAPTSPVIVPISELRNTNKISETCHKNNEPIFVTKNGYGDMVIMSIETYNSMWQQAEIDAAITKFETEREAGMEFIDAETALAELRRKHLG